MLGTEALLPLMFKPLEDTVIVKYMHLWLEHYIQSFMEEQSGIHFLVH